MKKTDHKINIYPSLLSDQRHELQDQLSKLSSVAPDMVVQFDVIDGKFAENLTCTPTDLSELDFGQLQFDFHLMTEEPIDLVHELIDVKDQLNIRAVIGQVERMSSQSHFLKEVQQQQWMPGLSLNLYTQLDAIEEESWEMMKVVQIMGVEAGFQGQKFHPSALKILRELHPLAEKYELEVIVDGGIGLDNISQATDMGANSLVVGSALWNAEDLADRIHRLQLAAKAQ